MSNLIKSDRVVDVGTPVNVGVSYKVTETNNIIHEKIKKISSNISSQGETVNTVNTQNTADIMTKEEIIEQYMKEAEEKAASHYQAEMKKAFDEGMLKAQNEAKKIIDQANIDYETIVEEVSQLKEQAIEEYKNEMTSNEKEIIDLAFQIAEKILNYEVNKSDDYIVGLVEDAVNRVVSKKDVCIKLSTQDYYTIQSNKKLLMTKVKGFGEIELIQDESLDPGSCIVDTPLGVIDGSLQVRMDNIQNEIQKLLAE